MSGGKVPRTITLTVELTPEQAAGLKRFAEKSGFEEAMAVLYPHIIRSIRAEQAATIVNAMCLVDAALGEAGVNAWPWIDSGRV